MQSIIDCTLSRQIFGFQNSATALDSEEIAQLEMNYFPHDSLYGLFRLCRYGLCAKLHYYKTILEMFDPWENVFTWHWPNSVLNEIDDLKKLPWKLTCFTTESTWTPTKSSARPAQPSNTAVWNSQAYSSAFMAPPCVQSWRISCLMSLLVLGERLILRSLWQTRNIYMKCRVV